MVNFKHIAATAFLALALPSQAQNLPTKEILGQEYFVYEIKKGDSLYGVTHRYGWDENELIRLNPNLSQGMNKGDVIYYPTGKVSVVEVTPRQTGTLPEKPEIINHVVKRGETVYGISKIYGIPVEAIYESHPSAKQGIKAGETIVIDQQKAGMGSDLPYFFLTVKPGDTLFSLAQRYNSTVEEILSENPGLSPTTLPAGEMIRIPLSDGTPKVKRALVEKDQVVSISSYTVAKNDTWTGISRKTGVSVDDLRQANEDVSKLKKNEVLAIPNIETVKVEEEIPYNGPSDVSAGEQRQIYDSIHHLDLQEQVHRAKVALILDDPSAKRDSEFTRGFLLALKQLGDPGFKVDFKVISGAEALDDVVASLNNFNPQIILNISDQGVNDWMLQFSEENGTEIVNVFDLKSDAYTTSHSVIQLMPPSNYFYSGIASELENRYGDRCFVSVSKTGEPDQLCDAVAVMYDPAKRQNILLSNLNPSYFKDGERYLIFADITDKEDIENLSKTLESIRETLPTAEFTVVGRPNWVIYSESLADTFYNNDVLIPSRFYFSPEDPSDKQFIEDYTSEFGRGPMKSYPNYAATGYDVANYFIPALALNNGDFNISTPGSESLQADIDLKRVSNWGGFYNPVTLLIHFTPYRTQEKYQIR